jgi:hypothetical protein
MDDQHKWTPDLLVGQEESSPFECGLSCPEVRLDVSASSSSFVPVSRHG